MTVAEPKTRRWTRSEYYHLAELGMFEGQRVQLIRGEILQIPPQGHRHTKAVYRVHEILKVVFGSQHWIRTQSPLDAADDSQPEPDVAVTEHDIDWYQDHPASLLLAVEVSDSTLRLDRRKAGLYAAAGVAEYWIVNLVDCRVEVFHEPVADPGEEFGHRYAQHRELDENGTISPLARPNAKVEVKSFFE